MDERMQDDQASPSQSRKRSSAWVDEDISTFDDDDLPVVLLARDGGVGGAREGDDGHALRARLRVVHDEDVRERADRLAEELLRGAGGGV